MYTVCETQDHSLIGQWWKCCQKPALWNYFCYNQVLMGWAFNFKSFCFKSGCQKRLRSQVRPTILPIAVKRYANKGFHHHSWVVYLYLANQSSNLLCISHLIHIILIIIMSHYQHGYPWHSLATPPYRSLLPVGLQGYIPYLHRAAVCRFELVVLHLLVHVKGSTGVHHLRARFYFSSSVLHIYFV